MFCYLFIVGILWGALAARQRMFRCLFGVEMETGMGSGIRRSVFLLGGTSHNPFRAPMYRPVGVVLGVSLTEAAWNALYSVSLSLVVCSACGPLASLMGATYSLWGYTTHLPPDFGCIVSFSFLEFLDLGTCSLSLF